MNYQAQCTSCNRTIPEGEVYTGLDLRKDSLANNRITVHHAEEIASICNRCAPPITFDQLLAFLRVMSRDLPRLTIQNPERIVRDLLMGSDTGMSIWEVDHGRAEDWQQPQKK